MTTHKHSVRFDSNPFTILVDAVKALFSVVPMLTILTIILPFGIWLLSVFLQLGLNIIGTIIDDQNTESPVVILATLFLVLLMVIVQIAMQVFSSGIAAVTGAASLRSQEMSVGEGIKLLLSRLWRFVGVGLQTLLYALPWVLLFIGAIVASVVLAIASPGYGTVIIPCAVIICVVLLIGLYRVFLRYALAGVAVFIDDVSSTEAMNRSKKLTKDRLIEVFGIMSFASMVPFLNVALMPAGLARTYEQRRALPAGTHLGKPHILNYLMLFIFLGFTVIFGLMLGAIIIFAGQ